MPQSAKTLKRKKREAYLRRVNAKRLAQGLQPDGNAGRAVQRPASSLGPSAQGPPPDSDVEGTLGQGGSGLGPQPAIVDTISLKQPAQDHQPDGDAGGPFAPGGSGLGPYHAVQRQVALLGLNLIMQDRDPLAIKRGPTVSGPTPSIIHSRPVRTSELVTQARNIVLNVFNYFENEDYTVQMKEILRRTSEATNVSLGLIKKLRKEGVTRRDGVIQKPPGRDRLSNALRKLDDFDKEVVRREILAFYERGELPTLNSLLRRLRKPPVEFRGGYTSLQKLLKIMGFRYMKRCNILMERPDNVAARNKFLRELESNRSSDYPRPEIYLDEICINENTIDEQRWTNKDGTIGPKTKIDRGESFVVIHAGNSEGFVPGAMLMFKSVSGNKGGYQDFVDGHTFKKWFQDQLMPNIPPRSLIIMDNAPYHNTQLIKAPAGNSSKGDIIKWLSYCNIPYDSSHTRPELYQLAQLHKKAKSRYEIDALAAVAGHEVLRLPPYYCPFNPIELIWAQIKQEIKKKKSNDNEFMKRVEDLILEAIDNVTTEDWKKAIEHSKRIQEDYSKKDIAFEHMFIESSSVAQSQSDSSSDESDDNQH